MWLELVNQANRQFCLFGIEPIEVITATINGEAQELPIGCTVSDLLAKLGLKSRALAVEVNQQLKPRDVHAVTVIAEGDVLEIVTLVGGG